MAVPPTSEIWLFIRLSVTTEVLLSRASVYLNFCLFRQLARHRLARNQLTFELAAMHSESVLALKNIYMRAAMRVGVRRIGVRPESAPMRIGMRPCAPECTQSAPMRAGVHPERHNFRSKQCKGNSETSLPA